MSISELVPFASSFVALIAAGSAHWVRLQNKRSDISADLAKFNFETLTKEIEEFRKERVEWTLEREGWHHERNELSVKIMELRMILNKLIILLEKNNIVVPEEAQLERLV